jgi:hypothetical protein
MLRDRRCQEKWRKCRGPLDTIRVIPTPESVNVQAALPQMVWLFNEQIGKWKRGAAPRAHQSGRGTRAMAGPGTRTGGNQPRGGRYQCPFFLE